MRVRGRNTDGRKISIVTQRCKYVGVLESHQRFDGMRIEAEEQFSDCEGMGRSIRLTGRNDYATKR